MSHFLVTLQFVLIAALGWPTGPLHFNASSALGLMVFCLGLALFAWSYTSMPRGSFTVMPEPRASGMLARNGPYAHVRHPMYSALMLCAIGAALFYSSQAWKWLAVIALLIVLIIKLRYEEQWLEQRYADYAQYKKKTKALWPWFW